MRATATIYLPKSKKPSLNAYVAEMDLQITNNNVEDNNNNSELKTQLCDHHFVFKRRNFHYDFFTILLLTYHMVQWMKVTSTRGQSYQDDEDLY